MCIYVCWLFLYFLNKNVRKWGEILVGYLIIWSVHFIADEIIVICRVIVTWERTSTADQILTMLDQTTEKLVHILSFMLKPEKQYLDACLIWMKSSR